MSNSLRERRALAIITTTLIILAVVAGLGVTAVIFYKGSMQGIQKTLSTLYSTNVNKAQEKLVIENVGYYSKTQSFNMTIDNMGYEPIAIQNVTLRDTNNTIINANTTLVSSPGTCNSGSGSTAITLDNPGKTIDSTSQSTTLSSFTVGSGTNRLLLVGIHMEDQTVTVSSVTYGGVNLSQVTTSTGSTSRTELWKLVNPNSGSAGIVVNLNKNPKEVIVGAISYTGVDQNTPIPTTAPVIGGGSGTEIDEPITTAYANSWIVDTITWNAESSVSAISGQTQTYQVDGTNFVGAGSYFVMTSPGSKTIKWSSNSHTFSALAVEIKASGGSVCNSGSGGSSSLTLDGSANNKFSTSSSGTVTLTTTNSNDIIIILVTNEDATNGAIRTVNSVTASGLSFFQRSQKTLGSPSYQDAEVWYAVATSPLSSKGITVTLSGSTDDAALIAFGVSGANTASPWDTNAALPAATTGAAGTIPTVTGVSTSFANDMVLGFQSNGNGAATTATVETAGSGYTLIQNVDNEGATNANDAAAEYNIVSTIQSNISIAFGIATSSSDAWIMIGDAIKPASGSSGGGNSISIDNVKTALGTNTNSVTISNFAVGSSANRLLLVGIGYRTSTSGSPTISSVTWNGHTLSKIVQIFNSPSNSETSAIYGWLNPESATSNIVVTLSSSTGSGNDFNVGAISFFGVDQTALPSNTNTASAPAGAGTSPSVTITTLTSNSLLFDTASENSGGTSCNTLTVGSGQAQQWSLCDSSGGFEPTVAASTKTTTTTGSYTMSWTASDSTHSWTQAVVEIKPAPTSSSSSSPISIPGSICFIPPKQSCTVSLGYHGFTHPDSVSVTTSRGNLFTRQVAPFVPWYNSQFQYRKEITINTNQVTTPLYNYTALISMTDSDLQKNAQQDGSDIVFTTGNGTGLLNFEIENYTSSTGSLTSWVKIPVLYNTPKNVIYMYYGSTAACNLQNPTGTWDSKYSAVYHFKENPGPTNSPIQLNNVQSVATSTDSSGKAYMQNFAVGPGTYRVLVVGVVEANNAITGVTYGSQSMTQVTSASNTVQGSIWYLINPTCQAATITTQSFAPAGTSVVIGAYSVYGADQTNPIYSHATPTTGNSGTPSITITNAHTNSWVLDLAGIANNGGLNNPTQKKEWSLPATTVSSGSSVAGPLTSGTPTTFQWTAGTSGPWIEMAVEIQSPFVPNLAIDGTVQTSVTNADVTSWTLSNFAVGSNLNRLLLVGVEVDDGHIASSVTYGGVPLNLVVTSGWDSVDVEFWDLVNPPVGTANIVLNTNGPSPLGIGVYSLYGVDQTTPIGAKAVAPLGQSCNGNPCTSVTITNMYKNSWVLDNSGIFDTVGMTSPSQTQQWVLPVDSNILELYDASSKKGPLASITPTTFTWNNGSNSNAGWDAIAVEVKNSSSLTVAPLIHDSTSNANHLSPYNMLATDLILGQMDGSFNFRATNYASDTSNPTNLPNPSTPMTASAWFWVSSNPSDTHDIFTLQSSSTSFLKMGFKSSTFAVWNNNNNLVSTTTLPTAGNWHYAVYTYDGTTHRLYIDNVLVNSCLNSSCAAQSFTPNALYVGTNSGLTELYNGHLDEIRISTIARSASWISTEYNNQASPSTFFTKRSPEYVLDARVIK